MVLTCQHLIRRYPDLWQQATVHPFLQQSQAGTIKPQQFNTWLVQDYLFVLEFTRMLAQVLRTAPPHHYDTLLGGMVALKDELNWFRAKASERQLDLETPRQPTCTDYCEFMNSLSAMPYAVQATALWAIELAYNQGWQTHSPMPPPYTEFGDRWGNPGFTEYVKVLEQQADEALQISATTVQQQADDAFRLVAQLEKDFWQMAFSAGC